MEWHVTDTFEIERSRLDLNLGLRNSVWFYHNAPCPGIGPIFTPKLYTLAIAGIHIARNEELSPITVANALEALSMKLTYKKSKGAEAFRGIRAFERGDDNFTYNFLKSPKNYVTNTYRQSTSRYLTEEFGAGLIKSGNKFSNYILSEKAESIISKLPNIDTITGWVCGQKTISQRSFENNHWLLMNRASMTDTERMIYLEYLKSELSERSFFKNFRLLRQKQFNSIEGQAKIEFDSQEHAILKASKTFFEIKSLIDNEVLCAGKNLENQSNSFVDVHTIEKNKKSKILQLINEHFVSIENSKLLTAQRNYIEESQNLFKELYNEKDDKRFILHLLKKAPDFFVVEGDKYRRAQAYDAKAFNKDQSKDQNIEAYSITNLKHQIEALG